MRIGIDISQIVYEGTGVATYMRRIVETLVMLDGNNDYVLFGASLRKKYIFEEFYREVKKLNGNVHLVSLPIPPILLDILWNRLHIIPVETFTGPLDIFWSSDWTQPPLLHARGVTTIHDLTTIRFPKEMDEKIVQTHAHRLKWVKKECQTILCDSKSTEKDIVEFLHIPQNRLRVVYPGVAF